MNRPDGRLATRRYQNIYDKNQSIGLKHIAVYFNEIDEIIKVI